jgi:hypothetical protein
VGQTAFTVVIGQTSFIGNAQGYLTSFVIDLTSLVVDLEGSSTEVCHDLVIGL